jgi:hypothetical protein
LIVGELCCADGCLAVAFEIFRFKLDLANAGARLILEVLANLDAFAVAARNAKRGRPGRIAKLRDSKPLAALLRLGPWLDG